MIKFEEYSTAQLGRQQLFSVFHTICGAKVFHSDYGNSVLNNVIKIGKLKKVAKKSDSLLNSKQGDIHQESFFHGIFGHLLYNLLILIQKQVIIDYKKLFAVFVPRWHEKPV